jgi:hypothetical protein
MDIPWEGKDLSEGGPSARLPTAQWTAATSSVVLLPIPPAMLYTFFITHSQICLMHLILFSHPVQ